MVCLVFWYTPSSSSFAACWDRNANTLTSNEELMFDEGEERATISVLHHCSGCKVIMSSRYQENPQMWLFSESYVQLVICSVEVWCCKKKSEIVSGNWGAFYKRGWLILLRSSQSTVQGQWIAIRVLAAGALSTKSIAGVEFQDFSKHQNEHPKKKSILYFKQNFNDRYFASICSLISSINLWMDIPVCRMQAEFEHAVSHQKY